MKKQKIALETIDYKGKRVVWYEESFQQHTEKRPELKASKNKVTKTLKEPQLFDGVAKKGCDALYRFERIDKYGNNLYFGVVVDYNSTPAVIKTAHLTPKPRGARIKI